MLKYLLWCVVVIVNLNEVMGAASEVESPIVGDGAPKVAVMSTSFPVDRLEAWDLHIHSLIQAVFTEAGAEYPLGLRDMCNTTFYAIEQGMKSLFENDLKSNQARVRDMLAPNLLKAEQEEIALDAKRSKQSAILEAMLNAHPMPKR